jgi:lysophospholipase L1-like esterase
VGVGTAGTRAAGRLRHYVALGDSISIDLYPALDLAGTSAIATSELVRGLGAASLLFENDDVRWPEFRGRDLASLLPGISFRNAHAFSTPASHPTDNFTADGATTEGTLREQVSRVEPSPEPTLLTVTVGGNDLLLILHDAGADPVPDMVARLRAIVAGVLERRPNATLLLGTVYDPTDGTSDLGEGPMPSQARWLAEYNAAVRRLVRETPGALLADIHARFLGQGLTAPEPERWYWSELIFEPNARGASEVRRLWLECLGM